MSRTNPRLSVAEQSIPAQIGAVLFRHRGWLPLLFLGIPLVMPGSTSPFQWEVGLALIVIGEAVRLAGVAAAGTVTRRRSRAVQRLVTYGIFSWVRNPLYIGNFLIWMGFVSISGVLWFLPIAVLLFAVEYELIVRYEEGVLESIFGREYLDYRNETPRWIPRPPKGEQTPGEYHWGEAFKSEISTFLQYAVLILAFWIKSQIVEGSGGVWATGFFKRF
ncbi:MAG TPA: isoprenylcysteine carboxylmethyltransferase family protein [Gemmatimonadaceae bacterium]|nr:isoprenylcysteine carboxylmethyltransferase family protein [Gemmatimonadaceae bacterium]